MYLLSSNALRVLHQTWTGPWKRRATRDPSCVRCRRQLWRVHTLRTSPAIARCRNVFLPYGSLCESSYIYVTYGPKRWDGADVPHSTLPECGTGVHAAAH